jgi:hypothetical protein
MGTAIDADSPQEFGWGRQADEGRPGRAYPAGTPTGGFVRELNRRSNIVGAVCRSDDRHVKSIYGTILEMGSSRMSVAPFDFSSGISVLTVALSTTVSMA